MEQGYGIRLGVSLLPYDCGVTLPDWQRYTTPKFLEACHVRWVSTELQLELVAFLRVLPPRWARYAFHWSHGRMLRVDQMMVSSYHQAEDMYLANMAAMTPEAGAAIVHAMRRGSWVQQGGIPPIIRACCFAARDRGQTLAEISDLLGISPWHVRRAFAAPGQLPSSASKIFLATQ